MLEPVAPFVRSKEQLEYEKRLQKRTKTLSNFKRMSMDKFKRTITRHMPGSFEADEQE